MVKTLAELGENEDFEMFLLLKKSEKRVAKNGKPFLAMSFADKSTEIGGMLWDTNDNDVEKFKPGVVVDVKGKRESYLNRPQIKISSIRLAVEGEPNDPADYVKRAPMKADEMKAELDQVIFQITNATYSRIVRALLAKHATEFFDFPAAKSNHHDFEGGLAFHTLSIIRLAEHIVDQYDGIDAPLLYAGAILHDLGKTIELSGPIGTTYTVEGNLLGHLSIIDAEIVEAADKLGIDKESEEVILLRHMVLAHHGLLEYGSPERPQLLEAEILHDLDELDASIMMIQGGLKNVAPGEFSDRIFGLDNRRFYKPEDNE
ncbi:HD domain-containing protein [Lentilactobacillus sp. Marseille-Q4993]|uniref:3'-5' exoribonuclease YhaM family protein n=1 Tax=Lentilactobacillus sp. Marseille-Q4993 TaxID=3039492 RepID=UPI0024BC1392|nr:HD domain-containing protein [Lentilactobacillus sp. Marseille-Q4993]